MNENNENRIPSETEEELERRERVNESLEEILRSASRDYIQTLSSDYADRVQLYALACILESLARVNESLDYLTDKIGLMFIWYRNSRN